MLMKVIGQIGVHGGRLKHSTRRCSMTGVRRLRNDGFEQTKEAGANEGTQVGSERILKTLNLFTRRVSALLLDTEKELDARLNQVMEHPESNLWDAFAKTPRRLRPRWKRKSI